MSLTHAQTHVGHVSVTLPLKAEGKKDPGFFASLKNDTNKRPTSKSGLSTMLSSCLNRRTLTYRRLRPPASSPVNVTGEVSEAAAATQDENKARLSSQTNLQTGTKSRIFF
jgi:hypothetical protein